MNEGGGLMSKCKVARNVEVDGKKFKVVDPSDPCSSVNRVLAKHEGAKMITPNEYEVILKAKETGNSNSLS